MCAKLLVMQQWRPGDLRPTGRGQEVAVVAPTHCRNGHRLGPNRVLVGTDLCNVDGRYRRHITWSCRQCDDVIVGDGHPDACRSETDAGE